MQRKDEMVADVAWVTYNKNNYLQIACAAIRGYHLLCRHRYLWGQVPPITIAARVLFMHLPP